MGLKVGNMSLEEKAFIDRNIHRLDIFDLASSLNRTPDAIKRYVRSQKRQEQTKIENSDVQHFLCKLHTRYYWIEICNQFEESELRFFEHKWIEYYKQFAEDVTPTEENEMIELIRVSILINRVMRDKQTLLKNVERLEKLLEIEMKKKPEEIDTTIILNLQNQIGSLIAAKAAFIKEYDTLTNKLEKFTKDLKGTRESRLKRADDAKTNFAAWLRYLDDEYVRKAVGDEMEKHAVAADKQYRSLASYHTYADGMVDKPFLNAETVE